MATATLTKRAVPRQNDILVDAGTNELEILTFGIGACTYGVNVAKVREVLRMPEKLVRVPGSHEIADGVFALRDHVVPLINLRRYFALHDDSDVLDECVIVMEFSNVSDWGAVVDSWRRAQLAFASGRSKTSNIG